MQRLQSILTRACSTVDITGIFFASSRLVLSDMCYRGMMQLPCTALSPGLDNGVQKM